MENFIDADTGFKRGGARLQQVQQMFKLGTKKRAAGKYIFFT